MAAHEVAADPSKVLQEENCFLTLFGEVLKKINNKRVSGDEISDSIEIFVDFFRRNGRAANLCSGNNFEKPADYLGYFYWISPISAAITRHKTLAAIRNCAEFRSCFHRPALKIVSVGGGTGSDLVGLYSAILRHSRFQAMQVVLMDKESNWKGYFQEIHGQLYAGDFGDSGLLVKSGRITTSFMRADMPLQWWKDLTSQCIENLREANIVWMKGFLSVLKHDSERSVVTEKIIESMSRGALLVVMEPPSYDQFDAFVNEKKLERIFNTVDGDYDIRTHVSEPDFRISTSSKQEMIIFQRV